MASTIQCKYVGCDSQGWDSYKIDGKIQIECTTCGREIEGNFVIGNDGWIKQLAKAGA